MDALRGVGWRLWFVQASWNREGMQSLGLVACALPWARRRSADGEALSAWIHRHLAFVNTNPYLAGLLLGAVLRLEGEGRRADAERLAPGLSRNLGAVGDAFSWDALRPALALLGLALALPLGPAGAAGAWLAFAAGQAWVRRRALREGFSRGLEVVALVAHPRIHPVLEWSRGLALGAAGAALGAALITAPAADPAPALGLTAGIALVCGFLALGRGWPVERVLAAGAAFLWILLRLGAWD